MKLIQVLFILLTIYDYVLSRKISCHNGGTPIGSRCQCSANFGGPACRWPRCHGNGFRKTEMPKHINYELKHMHEGQHCYCLPGWSGDFCEIAKCKHGKNDLFDKSKCICDRKHTGDRCHIVTDCGPHGTPRPHTDDCICEEGWEGGLCQTFSCYFGKLIESEKCQCYWFAKGIHCNQTITLSNTVHLRKEPNWTLIVIVIVSIFISLILFLLIATYFIMKVGSVTAGEPDRQTKVYFKPAGRPK